MINDPIKKPIKAQYDQSVHPRVFSKVGLVLAYNQDHEKLGVG